MIAITLQQIAVYGCIFNRKKELLLVKRALSDSSPHMWEIPGGSLELGESLVEGVIREVKEEVDLLISPLYPVTSISGVSRRYPFKQIIRIAYFAYIDSDSQQVTLSNEHSQYSWTNPDSVTLSPLSDLLTETLKVMKTYPYLFDTEKKIG